MENIFQKDRGQAVPNLYYPMEKECGIAISIKRALPTSHPSRCRVFSPRKRPLSFQLPVTRDGLSSPLGPGHGDQKPTGEPPRTYRHSKVLGDGIFLPTGIWYALRFPTAPRPESPHAPGSGVSRQISRSEDSRTSKGAPKKGVRRWV